jgi:hypothetical protein
MLHRAKLGMIFAAPLAVAVSLAAACGQGEDEKGNTGSTGPGGHSADAGADAEADAGAPCQAAADCDGTFYCHSDDEDCGPGHCRSRPRGAEFDIVGSCGCDGEIYQGANRARIEGIDVGGNWRCEVDPGREFRCGPKFICPGRIAPGVDVCCPTDGGSCPVKQLPTSICIHYETSDPATTGWGCAGAGFPLHCAGDDALKQCNGCGYGPECGTLSNEFSSVTCHEECLGQVVIECHP